MIVGNTQTRGVAELRDECKWDGQDARPEI